MIHLGLPSLGFLTDGTTWNQEPVKCIFAELVKATVGVYIQDWGLDDQCQVQGSESKAKEGARA